MGGVSQLSITAIGRLFSEEVPCSQRMLIVLRLLSGEIWSQRELLWFGDCFSEPVGLRGGERASVLDSIVAGRHMNSRLQTSQSVCQPLAKKAKILAVQFPPECPSTI